VIAFKFLGSSNPDAEVSYNWWASNSQGYPKDWGPWLRVNQEKWEGINPYGSGIYFPDTAMGTPGGDRSKYFVLSNGEIDFDQIFTDTLPKVDTSWIPAHSSVSRDMVEGFDIRFVYSLGPFDLSPGDSIFATLALVAGENFHIDPTNRDINLPLYPYTYYSNLDFSDLIENSVMAQQMYDTLLDFGPPAPIRNLKPGSIIVDGSITLTWIATGDDGELGKASLYDLRYSTLPAGSDTVSWWAIADTALNEPIPSEPESVDSCQVSGLSADSAYYFVIRACDNLANWSGFSNIGYTGLVGDINFDSEVDMDDILIVLEYLFKSGTQLTLLAVADVNGDCLANIVDVVYLINYVFKGGVSPQIGCA